jgi:hypothetical protein
MSEDLTPYRIEPIALSNESTVVAEFLPYRVREKGMTCSLIFSMAWTQEP